LEREFPKGKRRPAKNPKNGETPRKGGQKTPKGPNPQKEPKEITENLTLNPMPTGKKVSQSKSKRRDRN